MPFLRNARYAGMWSADLASGGIVARTILNTPIVFAPLVRGEALALYDRCPHRFAPLSRGRVEGETLACGYHGLRFDAAGACVRNPHGNKKIPPSARARRYPVVEKHSVLWIWMGDHEPQPDAIPDYRILDDALPEFVSKRDYIVMRGSYEIITDNLLDLSHINVLHDGLLGNTESNEAEIAVEVTGETVLVKRFSRDVPVPKVFDLSFRQDGMNVDAWNEMRWDPPACMLLDAGVTEPDTGKAAGTGIIGIHLLTPQTEHTTHYHFAAVRVNPPVRTPQQEIEIREELSRYRRTIFETQDAPMIAEQQDRILQSEDGAVLQLVNGLIAKHVNAFIDGGPSAVCSASIPTVVNAGPVDYCLSPAVHPPAGSYVFSSSVSTEDLVKALARYFRMRSWKRIGLVTSNDTTGQDLDRQIESVFGLPENKGIHLVAHEHFTTSDLSVAAQMSRIKAAAPDVVLTWSTGTPFGTLLHGISDVGIDVPIAAVSSNQTYAQWDPAMIVIDALRHAGPSASALQIRDYILKLRAWVGVNGTYDFVTEDQRGLGLSAAAVDAWDSAKGTWVQVSHPGGAPIVTR
jgi:phenylpropionate dioxygenase-like ring-hydroxylating dioxygenase large terminal subunit